MAPPVATLRARLARHPELDARAVLAVAAQEGLGGGIGDQGTSFGPFQLHYGGAYPTGAPRGQQASHTWAWSPAGIDYALSRISGVAGGLHGGRAVNAIVRRFERPADPGGEVARALAAYGGRGYPADSQQIAGGSLARPAAAPAPSGLESLLGDLIGRTNEALGLGGNPQIGNLLAAALSGHEGSGATIGGKAGQGQKGLPPLPAGGKKDSIAELLLEGTGGPTHSTGPHLHLATTSPQAMLAALAQGRRLGLAERENPYVDPVDPVHAPHSYHKINFPGLYNGRQLGQATDFSGNPQAVQLLRRWINQNLR